MIVFILISRSYGTQPFTYHAPLSREYFGFDYTFNSNANLHFFVRDKTKNHNKSYKSYMIECLKNPIPFACNIFYKFTKKKIDNLIILRYFFISLQRNHDFLLL
ncbi:MAG: hypothetical protein BGO33_09020 [Bacteroidia bacterium 43-41]|nr:MAG: hypothetical protein BGO33_09020 [Bacteroidia bacterium 43-41]